MEGGTSEVTKREEGGGGLNRIGADLLLVSVASVSVSVCVRE